jgi:hypothetical protein
MDQTSENKLRRIIDEMLDEYLPHINAIVKKYEHNINQLAIFLYYQSKTNQLTAILYFLKSLIDPESIGPPERKLVESIEPEFLVLQNLRQQITSKEQINFLVTAHFFEKMEQKCFLRILKVIQQKNNDLKILKNVLIASNVIDILLGILHLVVAFDKDDLFSIDEADRETDPQWLALRPYYKTIVTGKKEDLLNQFETENKTIYIFKAAYLKSTKSLINIQNHKILEDLISSKLGSNKDDVTLNPALRQATSLVIKEQFEMNSSNEVKHPEAKSNDQPIADSELNAEEQMMKIAKELEEVEHEFKSPEDDPISPEKPALEIAADGTKPNSQSNSKLAMSKSMEVKSVSKSKGDNTIGNIPSRFWQNTFNYMFASEVV